MATMTPKKARVTMLLSNGNKSDGTVKTLSVGIGTLNAAKYDMEKAAAVVDAVRGLLALTLYDTVQTVTGSITL